MVRVSRLAWVGAFFVWAGAFACAKPPESPTAAYKAFVEAVKKGQGPQAFARLSSATRAHFEAQAKAVEQATGGAAKEDPVALAFGAGLKPTVIHSVTTQKSEGDRVILEVESGETKTAQVMIRENGRWQVDWTQGLALDAGLP